jgi:hypothetical protein
LCERFDALACHSDVDQGRRSREVIVPQTVMHALKVPAQFAGGRFDGEQRLGIAMS